MPVENSNSTASTTSFKRKKLFYSFGAILNFLLVLIVIILFFVLFEEKNKINSCCKSFEVYYDTPEVEYTHTSIYGFYVLQNNKTNGRNWYRNDVRSIWWDGNHRWVIGNTEDLGGEIGHVKLRKYESCFPEISDTNWELGPSSHPHYSDWYDAGNKVKVRCGYKPKGK